MKTDKIYYEFFALSVLRDYDNKKFNKMKHSDSPDLIVGKEIGIEVTQLGTKEEFQFISMLQKTDKLTTKGINSMNNLGYKIIDGMIQSTAEHDEYNIFTTLDSKFNKLKSGVYSGFKEFHLFMFLSDTIENVTINDIVKFFSLTKNEKNHYKVIYILCSTYLYVYDVENDTFIDVIDICSQIKKHRNYAVNKKRDFYNERNYIPMKKYISDPHLGHGNINTKHDKRGFETTEEMDEYIIKQWNSSVNKNDEVYILGDLSFLDGEKTNEYLKRLNGKKYLIKGNHDRRFLKDDNFNSKHFEWVKESAIINDDGRKVILSHYPQPFYFGQYRTREDGSPQSYMLYGHIHNTQDMKVLDMMLEVGRNFVYKDRDGKDAHIPFNLINCFCVFSDYKPLTLDEWIELEKQRNNQN